MAPARVLWRQIEEGEDLTPYDVLMVYNTNKSIRRTAAQLGVAQSVVRKSLVTYRVLDTALTRRIAELRATGMSQKDIAELLGLSTNCVNSNCPYERGTYLHPSQTLNAIRIRETRERKNKEDIPDD